MKKIVALCLSALMVFCLVGCGEKEEEKKDTVDLKYYAELGQIPESKVKLGDSVESVKSALEKEKAEVEEKGEHFYLYEEQGENNALIKTSNYEYYYKKANPEKGIAYMVTYDSAYGFELGTVILEIKEALEGYEFTEEKATDVNAFFYMGNPETSDVLKVKFEKSTIMFMFEDNGLCATVIYSNENWS